MVVSLMNYPIIWPNSGDGSRQRNSGTGNRKKLCFVISIWHLAQLTLEIHSAARGAIRVSLAPPQSHSCLERRTSAHLQLLWEEFIPVLIYTWLRTPSADSSLNYPKPSVYLQQTITQLLLPGPRKDLLCIRCRFR